ncbi:helix-turn-helix domain-containing protein [Leptospira kanakyensis]|uniref:Helix-turn-helix domain-containing protein n=1 Tax=Leptospira kanakyensis TaxID=2484968 RepID=A0A6N4Q6T7_9LEPT|nr:helix-turn-helix domain-containing protein [Leptospira kanakyensis]TGK54108.1 helix-turn-helix domain-containing protein [Leptospira kanakyensis]TGK57903.1 helix-turn-helix domain-containing protein [Leptospira kanakyensis]TGK73611.1 helix-turn-helix domain-containing protein [Leptospira kanakyensis]
MKVDSFFPSENLKPYIQKYLIIESEEGIENRILPNPNLVLSFQLKGNLKSEESNSLYDLPKVGLAGFRKSARTIIYPKNSSALLVLFSEVGAFTFFQEPISEFYGKTVSLEDLFPRPLINRIEEQLFVCKSNTERISLIENFLHQIKKNRMIDPIITNTLLKIKETNGKIKIGEIRQGLPISIDSLEKKFKVSIGTTLKHYSNLLRIRSVISSHSQKTNLTDLAYHAGYFDQSHFNKEFKLFTGSSPKEYFKNPQNW